MKRMFFLVFATLLIGKTSLSQEYINGTAEGAGFLKKSEYGKHSDEEEVQSAYAGTTVSFSNLKGYKMKEYGNAHAQQFLGEKSVQSAFENSSVVELPLGTKITTMDAYGNAVTRNVYPGEKFYRHNPTGKIWLSLYCWNPVFVLPSSTSKGFGGGGYTNREERQGEGGKQEYVITASDRKDIWKEQFSIYSKGREDRESDMLVDAEIYTRIQKAKECCGGGSGGSLQASERIIYTQQVSGGNGGGGGVGSILKEVVVPAVAAYLGARHGSRGQQVVQWNNHNPIPPRRIVRRRATQGGAPSDGSGYVGYVEPYPFGWFYGG